MTTLHTTASIIDALGGNVAVGKLLGSKAKAVWNWRAGGKFPAHSYVALRQALSAQGLSAPDHLWAMTKPRRRRSAASASA